MEQLSRRRVKRPPPLDPPSSSAPMRVCMPHWVQTFKLCLGTHIHGKTVPSWVPQRDTVPFRGGHHHQKHMHHETITNNEQPLKYPSLSIEIPPSMHHSLSTPQPGPENRGRSPRLGASCEAPGQGPGTAFGGVLTLSGVSACGAKHHRGVKLFSQGRRQFLGYRRAPLHPPLFPSSS